MLDNTPNQQTKFRTKNWVELNNDARGNYNIDKAYVIVVMHYTC